MHLDKWGRVRQRGGPDVIHERLQGHSSARVVGRHGRGEGGGVGGVGGVSTSSAAFCRPPVRSLEQSVALSGLNSASRSLAPRPSYRARRPPAPVPSSGRELQRSERERGGDRGRNAKEGRLTVVKIIPHRGSQIAEKETEKERERELACLPTSRRFPPPSSLATRFLLSYTAHINLQKNLVLSWLGSVSWDFF